MDFKETAQTIDGTGIFGLSTPVEEAALVLIPVPFDATASYGRTAAEGPAAILEESAQIDLFDLDTGNPSRAGIAMLAIPDDVRRWNDEARDHVDIARASALRGAPDTAAIEAVNVLGGQVNRWLRQQVEAHWKRGAMVGVVGGDHSVPLATIQAHAERYPGLGVLHIDAHADLRLAYESFLWSHASIMRNVLQHTAIKRLVQVGIRDFCEAEHDVITQDPRVTCFFDATLARRRFAGASWSVLVEGIVSSLPQHVYVSLDIDGLDPALCPHTGTPVPGGLQFQELSALLHAVTRSGRRIVGFDLSEVAPGPGGDPWDGNVGMRVLYKLCGHTLMPRNSERP